MRTRPILIVTFKYLTTDDCVNLMVFIYWNDIAKALGEHRRVVILIQHLDSQLNLNGVTYVSVYMYVIFSKCLLTELD